MTRRTIKDIEAEWVARFPTIEDVTTVWWREYYASLKAMGAIEVDPFIAKAVEAVLQRSASVRIIAELFEIDITTVEAIRSGHHKSPPNHAQLYHPYSGAITSRFNQAKRLWRDNAEYAIASFYFGDMDTNGDPYHYLSVAADQFRNPVELNECGDKAYPGEFCLQTSAAYWHLYQTFKLFGQQLPERTWH